MEISLMTIKLSYLILMKMHISQDKEEAMEDYEEMLDVIKETGYAAIDITESEIDTFGIDYIKDQIIKRNLKVASVICFGAFTSMKDEDSTNIIEASKKAIDDAVTLNAKVVMLDPRAQENIADYQRKELADRLIKHWIPVVEYAKKKGIHIVAEDTPDLRIPLCTVDEMQYVLDRVPGLEVVYDSGNTLLVKEEPVTYFNAFADHIVHIHLKDMQYADADDRYADTRIDGTKMTGSMIGKGFVDFKTLLEHIKSHGYEGYLTIEYAPDEDGNHRKGLVDSREYIENLL